MECIHCFKPVTPARIEAGYKYCMACAEHVPKVKGVNVYSHKTAGEIQVVTPDQFSEHRRYNPYGRNTGRGSGLHRVMQRSDR
jgi:hypothetical protein